LAGVFFILVLSITHPPAILSGNKKKEDEND
jgi:hypothetical protein